MWQFVRCLLCNKSINPDIAKCPVCGFRVIHTTYKNNEINNNVFKQIKIDYLEYKLSGISVGLKVYDYAVTENDVTIIAENDIILCECKNLRPNEITWFNDIFEEIISDRKFALCVFVKKQNESNRVFKVDIMPNRNISHSKIGVILDNGLTFRIVIGKENDYISSRAIQLL